MAQTSYPLPPGRVVTEPEYERLTHPLGADGVVGAPPDTAVVYADSTGLQVKVRPDKLGHVRGYAWESGPTEFTLSITPNSSGSTRVDLVVLRLTRATWAVTIEVRAGTPGAGAPAPVRDLGSTGVYEVPVVSVTVVNGAVTIAAEDVPPAGWWVNEDGEIVCTSTVRPPHAPGRRIYETDTKRSYISDGTTWGDGIITCTSTTRPSHLVGRRIYETDTKRVHVSDGTTWGDGHITCTSTTRPPHLVGRRIYETDTKRSFVSDGTNWIDGIITCTSTTRPPHSAGRRIYETDTSRSYISNGTSWLVLLDPTATAVQYEDLTAFTFTNTAAQPGTPVCGGTFVAPQSGKVAITVSGMLQSDQNAHAANLSYEVRTGSTVGSGTVVLGVDYRRAIVTSEAVNAGASAKLGASHRRMLTGLTPGSTYNVRTLHWIVGAGGGGTIEARSLLIEPVPW